MLGCIHSHPGPHVTRGSRLDTPADFSMQSDVEAQGKAPRISRAFYLTLQQNSGHYLPLTPPLKVKVALFSRAGR